MRGEFIDLGGERIYYYAAGTRGSGDPIVLIHGFPTSSHIWADVVAKLPSGRRVIVMDLLGFGRRDAPTAADYSIAGHANRVRQMLGALRIDRCVLVGHDIGSAVALSTALADPDHVGGVAMIDFDASKRSFSGQHAIMRIVRTLLLLLPIEVWMPFVRRTIARRYADPERGRRSAEIYLMPFTTPAGARVLQRHYAALLESRIDEIARRATELRVPSATSSATASRSAPEESPSEVAATIARVAHSSSASLS
jgi:Predicted hydrolases or acyltransferases (alpha/beta hydrolase superfamily)